MHVVRHASLLGRPSDAGYDRCYYTWFVHIFHLPYYFHWGEDHCLLKETGFAHMKNYFSASSHLQTNDFIGLVIWMAGFIPAVLIKPEKLQIPFFSCFVLFCGTCFGLLIW
jgi:hypothetical protein